MYIGGIPIVSLDSVYLDSNDKDIIFLDCTRLDGSSDLVSRINPNDKDSVNRQIKSISDLLKKNGSTSIILADDVVFSGSVLRSVSSIFRKNGINVVGIRACVSTDSAYSEFSKLPLGIKCGCLMGPNVIDQICERDFYFGVAQSGISVNKDGVIYKAPYFKPFGDPVERASIPEENSDTFSKNCIIRSLALWDRIEKLSGREILIKDLPEVIQNTNDNSGVCKTLRKELKRDIKIR